MLNRAMVMARTAQSQLSICWERADVARTMARSALTLPVKSSDLAMMAKTMARKEQ